MLLEVQEMSVQFRKLLKIQPRVYQLIVQKYLNEAALAVTSATCALLFIKPQEFLFRLCCKTSLLFSRSPVTIA